MRQAIAEFSQAIARDADFAPAYAALADAHIWFYSGLGVLPAAETVPQARRAVDKALTLDANLAHAHKVRGLIAMNHDWDRKRRGTGAHARPPARSRLGVGASVECLAARAARKASRSGAHRAGGGRASRSAGSSGEDADWLRPPFPSRSRSRHRAVRKGGGARAVLCICTLRAG